MPPTFPMQTMTPQYPAKEPKVVDVKDFDLKEYFKKHIAETRYLRSEFERGWYRNILFYSGQQWISYSPSAKRWKRADLPKWFPTPVTNKFATHVDGMAAVLEQAEPEIAFGPATDAEEDIATADVADDISDTLAEEVVKDELEEEAAKWIALTGNAFLHTTYDTDPTNGTQWLAAKQCMTQMDAEGTPCGWVGMPQDTENGCPRCGQYNNLQDAANPQTGEPIGEEVPRGKLKTDVLSPFQVYTDLQCRSLKDAPYVIICRTMSVDELKGRWPDQAELIKPEGSEGDLGSFYLASLAYVTGTGMGDSGLGGTTKSGSSGKSDRATEYEIYIRPTRELPKGAHGFLVGGNEMEKGELPYHDSEQEGIIPLVHLGFKRAPGRFFYKTPADDLAPKQIQRNKLEALIQLGIHRMSNPVWLLPDGCGVEDVTGEPGEKIKYNVVGTVQAKPERIAGMDMPQSTFAWIDKIDADMEDISSMYDIMKGESPDNVGTLGGMEILRDRAMGRFRDVLKNWRRGWIQWNYHALWIFKEHGWDTRRKVSERDNGSWDIQQFTNANLTGNVVIRAEGTNLLPESEAYQRMTYAQLLSAGLVDVSDPLVKLKFFQKFHATELMESMDENVKDAIQERDEFLQTGQTRFNPIVDDHQVHFEVQRRWARTEEFRSLPPEAQTAWLFHLDEHKQFLDAQAAAAQQAQLEMQVALKGNGPGGLVSKGTNLLQTQGGKKAKLGEQTPTGTQPG